jgi:Ca-activated chloride channel family protein
MRFADPSLLWGLLLLPILFFWILASERRRRRDLARWMAPEVWKTLASERSPSRRRVSIALLLLALLVLLLGAARPQLGQRILETRQRGIDVVVAVDVSLSMQAQDIQPSRSTRARSEVLALLDQLEGDRIALVSFAGQAFLQSPLTLDRGAIRMLLPLLDPEIMPEPGSNLATAIQRSIEAFQPDPDRGRALILVTDGEAHQGELEEAVALAKEERVRISAIGVGRADGVPIPLASSSPAAPEYKKDRHDRVVVTRLEEEGLRRACEATGGVYARAEAGGATSLIYKALRDLDQGELEGGLGMRYEERYAYFVALALGLLLVEGLLGERRRLA